MAVIEDKKEKKRRKKQEKAKRRALEEDIRPISSAQGLGPDTLLGEDSKAKDQKDGSKVEEPKAEVCLSKCSIKPAMSMSLIGNGHSGD